VPRMPLASSVATVAIIVVVAIIVLGWAMNSLGRSAQVARGRNKCAACGTRLKKVGAGYAPVCRKCGQKQPWVDS
jgi:hypothetical protein